MVPTVDGFPGDVAWCLKSTYIRRVNGCLTVQWEWCTIDTSCVRPGGAHASLSGSYMTKLRAFTVQAEAEGRWACNRDPARSSSLQKGSAHTRDVRQRDPYDGSPVVRLIAWCLLACQMSRLFMCLLWLLLCLCLARSSMMVDHPYCRWWFGYRTLLMMMSLHPMICWKWSLLRGVRQLCRRLACPCALVIVLLFSTGILCWETVCIVLVRCRWWIPSRQLCPYFPVTLTRIWKMNSLSFSLCRRQYRMCLLMLLWGWGSCHRVIGHRLCPPWSRQSFLHGCLPAEARRWVLLWYLCFRFMRLFRIRHITSRRMTPPLSKDSLLFLGQESLPPGALASQ